jgi:hypothetical protein
MREFNAILPLGPIEHWVRMEPEISSVSGNEVRIGGVFILSMLSKSKKKTPFLRVFPIFWEQRARDGRNQVPFKLYVGRTRIPDSLTDMELIQLLTNLALPSYQISIEQDNYENLGVSLTYEIRFDTGETVPKSDFQLAFLDMGKCQFLGFADEAYYYKDLDNNGFNTLPYNRGIQVSEQNRGILLSRGLFKIPYQYGWDSYHTLLAKPSPLPEINIPSNRNDPGALAYEIIQACPPLWRPGESFMSSIGHLILPSAFEAFRKFGKYS